MERHPFEPSPEHQPKLEQLAEQVGEKLALAETLGVHTQAVVVTEQGYPVITHRADEVISAASVNKLAVARTIEDLAGAAHMQDSIDLQQVRLAQGPGGGAFETADRPMHASVEDLYHDMLVRSGNSSTIALVEWLGGPQVVNEHMEALGFATTRLQIIDGGFYLGDTTPSEVIRLLQGGDPRDETPYSIGSYLRQNTETNGSKKYIPAGSVQVALKSGALHDPDDGDFRHDVGWMFSPASGKSLLFAVMTHIPPENSQRRLKWGIAEGTLAQLGADMAESLGVSAISRRRRFGAGLLKATDHLHRSNYFSI